MKLTWAVVDSALRLLGCTHRKLVYQEARERAAKYKTLRGFLAQSGALDADDYVIAGFTDGPVADPVYWPQKAFQLLCEYAWQQVGEGGR